MNSDGRRLWSRWHSARHGEGCKSGLGDQRIARARLRDRDERTKVATETSEAKIVTRSTSEKLVDRASGPAKAGSSA
jgi:hypothetical protein